MIDEKNGIVSRDPEIVSGELVFAGTRVPAKTLIDYLKAGDTLDAFLDDFPTVSREKATAYLDLTLKAADLARSAR
jgi:uncharacterized protein (DUF433 family)